MTEFRTVTAKDIGWGSYLDRSGPFYRGGVSYKAPENPVGLEKYLAVLVANESGGHVDAVNFYDRCICTIGLIQLCESANFQASNLLGAIGVRSRSLYGDDRLLQPLQDFLADQKMTFGPTPEGAWRYHRAGKALTAKQDLPGIFYAGVGGQTNTWTPTSRQYSKEFAAVLANVLRQPEAVTAQVDHVLPKLLGYVLAPTRKSLWGSSGALVEDGYVGAVQAAVVSFAANLPVVASNQYQTALAEMAALAVPPPLGSRDWACTVLKRLTFGPNIAIYPHRYNAIRPVIERLYGVDLPDFASELAQWKVQMGLPPSVPVGSIDVATVKGLQEALLQLGYLLGPSGADGQMGPKTTAAVKEFQTKSGLKADGLVGPKTTAALLAALLASNPK